MKKYLYGVARKINIHLSDEQLDKFQLYYNYLIEMNKVMNLTAIMNEKDIVLKHFIDSIAVANWYSFSVGMKVIDMGTGAGFPGIPLAILFPDITFTLMDSLNKRIRFLTDVKKICQLPNVECIHSRAEELGRNEMHREQYDICVSRAVAMLPILLEYCIPFIRVGGVFISYKSVLAENELQKAKNAQKILSCQLSNNVQYEIPDTDYQRCFLIFEKKKPLHHKYPRQNGIPKKSPLE